MIAESIKNITSELPPETILVAVSKFHPAESIIEAYEAGQRVFAESRPQELEKKVAALSEKCPDIEWQFIGHLQTNKLKMVLPYVSLVQSVDSLHLLEDIDKWAKAAGRVVNVLLELHVAQEETKQGFFEEEVLDLMFRYYDSHCEGGKGYLSNVRIKGLMAMATNTDDVDVIRADFGRARAFMDYLTDLFPELEDFSELSIGMSSDWKTALEFDTTMVRIGTAIFGERNY